MKIGYWEFDFVTKNISCSSEMYKIYDRDPANFNLNQKSLICLIYPEDRQLFVNWVTSYIEGIKAPSIVFRIVNSDNTTKYIRGDGEFFFDQHGQPLKIIGTAQDITELKVAELKLKEIETFNNGILSSLPYQIAVIDKDGTIICVNKAWENFPEKNNYQNLVTTAGENNYFTVCKKNIALGNEYAKEALLGIKAVLNKEISQFQMEYPINSNKKLIWFDLIITCFEGEDRYAVLSHFDITAKKKSEEELNFNLKEISNSEKINRAILKGNSIEEISDLLLKTLNDIAEIKSSRIYLFDEYENKLNLVGSYIENGFILELERKIGKRNLPKSPSIQKGSVFRDIIDNKTEIITSNKDEIRNIISALYENKNILKIEDWIQKYIDINTLGILSVFSNNNLLGLIVFTSSRIFNDAEKKIVIRFLNQASIVLKKKQNEIKLTETEAYNRGILSSLNSFIAVINPNGVVISINESWKKAAQQKEVNNLFKTFLGNNYFKICEQALAQDHYARKILNGLHAILKKETLRFELEYPCYTLNQKYWFIVSITSFEGNGKNAVLRFVDITERKKSELELNESKKLVQSIYEASPDAVIITDGKGIITKWDTKSEELFGWNENEVLGLNLAETIMPQRYHEAFYSGLKHFSTVQEGAIFKKPLETALLKKNGLEFYVSINTSASLINGERYFIGFIRDITERKKSEQLLFESQRLYKTLIDNMNDGFFVENMKGEITFANQQFCEIFGIKNKDINNFNQENFEALEFREELYKKRKKRLSGEQTHDSYEFKGLTIAGKSLWLEARINPIIEKGNRTGSQHVIRDITIKKKAEELLIESETKIRNFANHLNKVLEDERTSLAREIHDELGQQLAGIKFGISSLKKTGANNPNSEQKIKDLLNEVDTTIQNLRKIATSLRPGILDTLGLASSIEWLVNDYEKRKGVSCNLEIDVNEQQFNKNISTCFFRICQESLTNISKHTNADAITIMLYLKKKKLTLIIKDNGKGMDIHKQKNPFSMGLMGMKERANSIGANFEIVSEIGKGTIIKTEVIINPET
jgi:PAS domain S-box-containing protein